MSAEPPQDLEERFEGFFKGFKDQKGELKYRKKIQQLSIENQISIIVDFDDLLRHDPDLARELLEKPDDIIKAANEAAMSILELEDLEYHDRLKTDNQQIFVRYRNLPSINHIPLRKIRSEHIGLLVMIDGILTRASEVKPRLLEAAFECLRCHYKNFVKQETTEIVKPIMCENVNCRRNGPFKLISEESRFEDWQKIRIQEKPEELPPGQLPRAVDTILTHDLVDLARPGDRVSIIGVLRSTPEYAGRTKLSTFKVYLDANYLDISEKELEKTEITPEDEQRIIALSRDPEIHSKIIRSIAPSIYGIEDIKEAVALQLFGGVSKILPDSMKIRGESNVLLVGDPGTAKCVAPGTRVLLASGETRKIEDIIEEKLKENRKIIDDGYYAYGSQKILTMSRNGVLKPAETNIFWKRSTPEYMLRIKTKSGKEITVTPTHPFFITDNGLILSKKAKDLGRGDFVATPRNAQVKTLKRRHDLQKPSAAELSSNEEARTLNAEVAPLYGRELKKDSAITLVPGLGGLLKEIREERKLTQSQMGIPRSSYHRYETGKRLPSVTAIKKICAYLEKYGSCIKIERLKNLADSDIFWDKITAIEKVRPNFKWVYDLQVPETNNFIANGIIVHNSQILQYAAQLAPRGLYTSGKGSSAAGLTAAVLKDESGAMALEAGALVLADRGLACLHPETEIIFNNEVVPIHKLFNKRSASKRLSNGEEVELNPIKGTVKTFDLQKLESTEKKSLFIRRKKYSGKLLHIKLNSGFELKVTPDHKLINGDNLTWRAAEEFKKGDLILAPLKIKGHEEEIYIFDIVPEDWSITLSKNDSQMLKEIILKRFESISAFNKYFKIKNNTFIETPYFKLEKFRKILDHLGLLKAWREKPFKFLRGNNGEILKINKITPGLAYFIGYVHGDGSYRISRRRSSIEIKHSLRKREITSRLKQVIQEISYKKLEEYSGENSSIIIGNKISGKYVNLHIESNLLAFITDYFLKDNLKNIMKLPQNCLKAFIAGALDSNGHISVKQRIKNNRKYFAVKMEFLLSGNKKNALAFMLALRRLDVYSKLKLKGNVNSILITGREDTYNLCEALKDESIKAKITVIPSYINKVTVTSEKLPAMAASKIYEDIGKLSKSVLIRKGIWSPLYQYNNLKYRLSRTQLEKIRDELGDSLPRELTDKINLIVKKDYFLDKIVSVNEKYYKGYVYDLYVPEHHNFYGGGVWLHNCIDEFDKMNPQDRVAIHEAMEQRSYHPSVEISLCARGKVAIGKFVEDLFERYRGRVYSGLDCEILSTLDLDYEVYTTDFKEVFRVKVNRVSRHKAPAYFIRVGFSNGRNILVTPDHPLFILDTKGNITTIDAEKADLGLYAPGLPELDYSEGNRLYLIEGDENISEQPYSNSYRGNGEGWVKPISGISYSGDMLKLRFLTITRIERVNNSGKLKTKWVYDVTVEPTANFISNGLVLHNTVSIAKAGIIATLNARTSILAAANPALGRYSEYRSPADNIKLPVTLLSRFDLIFIVTDKPDVERDRKIADHILSLHRRESMEPPIEIDFLRKYITYAKRNCTPSLSQEAANRIEEFYLDMRKSGEGADSPIPITARQLEALVRLVEARAKMALKREATVEDAEAVIRIIKACLRQVGVDKETGKMDIDILMTGAPKSQRDRLSTLLDVISSLEREQRGAVPVKDVLERAREYQLEEAFVKEAMQRLLNDGTLFEPEPGYVRKAS